MSAYEDAVSEMVDELNEAGTSFRMHKIRCGNCGRFLGTTQYRDVNLFNVLCIECTDECMAVIGSLDSEGNA